MPPRIQKSVYSPLLTNRYKPCLQMPHNNAPRCFSLEGIRYEKNQAATKDDATKIPGWLPPAVSNFERGSEFNYWG